MSSATLEEVWKLFREVAEVQREVVEEQREAQRQIAEVKREVAEVQRESTRSLEETKRLMRENSEETKRLMRENLEETRRLMRESSEETDRKLAAISAEGDRHMAEIRREIRESSAAVDRQIAAINKKIGDLGNRLGEFVENMVRPAALRLFRERGIAVHQVLTDIEVDEGEDGMQIDLLVVNATQAVMVEVKSKLTQPDVDEHLERLAKFKQMMPRYADVQAMGAIAAMVIPKDLARYAYRKGLFVLAQTGDNMSILNDPRFQPRIW